MRAFLGLEVVTFEAERHVFFRCDDSVLILFKASKTVVPDAHVPPHGTTGAGHLAFRASTDGLGEWKNRLTESGVPVIDEVDWGNGAKSIYFKDPAGNILEFATPNLWGFE
jgi:catechol 2,3-dioxygenase-like lactoylglutathione lyase family enzyme